MASSHLDRGQPVDAAQVFEGKVNPSFFFVGVCLHGCSVIHCCLSQRSSLSTALWKGHQLCRTGEDIHLGAQAKSFL